MLREMDGAHIQEWKAEFTIREEERRDRALDAKGKARVRRMRR